MAAKAEQAAALRSDQSALSAPSREAQPRRAITPRLILAADSSPYYRALFASVFGMDPEYTVDSCEHFEELVRHDSLFDAVVLVVNFADTAGDGSDLYALRRRVRVPIVTLVESPGQQRLALQHGSDYDLAKPFDPELLLLAVGARLRDGVHPEPRVETGRTDPFEALVVFRARHAVRRDGTTRILSRSEWGLFEFLLDRPGRAFSRVDLGTGVWGRDHASRANKVELYVSRVRRKVELDARRPELIETVSGVGYRLRRSVPILFGD